MIHTIIRCDESPRAIPGGYSKSLASHNVSGARHDLGLADNSEQHGQRNSNSDHEKQALSIFPLLMIHGVYRSSSAMGVHSYSFPAIQKTSSRYQLRRAVRAARQAIVARFADSRQREV